MTIKPVHLIMPHYNGKFDVTRAYMSIMDRTRYPFVLTIIDDGSSESDAGKLFLYHLSENKPENVNILFNEKNVGVTTNLNKGFSLYPELDCVRLDADIEIQSSMWLNQLVDFADAHKNVGVVAPINLFPDMVRIASAGQQLIITLEDLRKLNKKFSYEIFGERGKIRFDYPEPIEVDSVLGCCCLYKREVIDKLGGVDDNYFGWVEDNDFCVGARNLGYKVFVLPSVSFCHHEHAAKRSTVERERILEESEKHFVDKWGFSLYGSTPYWDEIVKRYKGTEVLWRYNQNLLS